LVETGVNVSPAHLIVVRAIVDPGNHALEVAVGWLGAGSGAVAAACRPCTDATWRGLLARELGSMARFIEEVADTEEHNRGSGAADALSAPEKN
jgi:hypothetical protein